VNLLVWIEESALAEWVRISAYGYPAMITLHSLGMAIIVGLSVVLSLRALGLYKAIPFASLQRLLPLAWVGFVVNFLSGSALFAAQATTYIVDFEFLLKMAFVVLGVIFVGLMQNAVGVAVASGAQTAGKAGVFAIGTIVAWFFATVTGRLIAYL
jgi:hypothetical protein